MKYWALGFLSPPMLASSRTRRGRTPLANSKPGATKLRVERERVARDHVRPARLAGCVAIQDVAGGPEHVRIDLPQPRVAAQPWDTPHALLVQRVMRVMQPGPHGPQLCGDPACERHCFRRRGEQEARVARHAILQHVRAHRRAGLEHGRHAALERRRESTLGVRKRHVQVFDLRCRPLSRPPKRRPDGTGQARRGVARPPTRAVPHARSATRACPRTLPGAAASRTRNRVLSPTEARRGRGLVARRFAPAGCGGATVRTAAGRSGQRQTSTADQGQQASEAIRKRDGDGRAGARWVGVARDVGALQWLIGQWRVRG